MRGADQRRRMRAIGAALEVAAAQGVVNCDPCVLKDSNNTVVQLMPARLVAKVGTSVLGQVSGGLEHELAVGLHLAAASAPIAPPSCEPSPGPHLSDGLVVTLWRFCENDPAREIPAAAVAASLRALHRALATFEGELPAFTVELQAVGAVLVDEAAAHDLEPDDRELLRLVHADLTTALASRELECRPLHGGPHSGNLLSTLAGPLWIDLETACRGPLEWDLAAMPATVTSSFPEADRELLALLQAARSLCVAVKCWMQPMRAPEVAEAAELHLRWLRERTHARGDWAAFCPRASRFQSGGRRRAG